jgi:hypothetical protein
MRRRFPIVAAALLSAAASARAEPPGEAEALLREVDAKITAAKALRIEYEITGDAPGFPARGSVVLADRNRFRCEVTFKPTLGTWLAVGDGKRTVGSADGSAPPSYPSGPAPAWHNETLRRWLGRGGTAMSALMMAEYLRTAGGGEPGPAVGPATSNARLLPDEEIGGVKARVVEYDLTWKGVGPEGQPPTSIKVRVWIDPKTKLPVRRAMDWGKDAFGLALTAVHTKFEIDPKLDDRLFELPR